jgi:hypothetical protein
MSRSTSTADAVLPPQPYWVSAAATAKRAAEGRVDVERLLSSVGAALPQGDWPHILAVRPDLPPVPPPEGAVARGAALHA